MSERPISTIDHDSIFKQMLSEFFVEFLELFAPDALALLEQESLIFLDKESFVDLIDPDRREADLAVLHPNQQEAIMELVSEWEVKGRVEGKQELVVRLLTKRFGPLTAPVQQRIGLLTSEQLNMLGEAVLDFTTAGDLTSWLEAHAAQSSSPN